MLKIVVSIIAFCTMHYSLWSQEYRQTSIYAGEKINSGVPAHPNAATTVVYKASNEIVLGPDDHTTTLKTDNFFSTVGYDGSSTTTYFHALLIPPFAYSELATTYNAGYFVTVDHVLYFKYNEKYNEGNLNYQIFNYKQDAMVPSKSGKLLLTKKPGANYYELDMRDISLIQTLMGSGVTEEKTYFTLEVYNDKNEKFVLRFKYTL